VVADPARVRDPNRKGTAKHAVGRTQAAALKGHRLESIVEQNEFLAHWEQSWAAQRGVCDDGCVLQDWGRYQGDATMASNILDRLMHRCAMLVSRARATGSKGRPPCASPSHTSRHNATVLSGAVWVAKSEGI